MEAGRSSARILLVPRPRTGVAERVTKRAERTTIRTVRRVAPRSAQGVLLRAAREARDPCWSLVPAAQALVAQVGGDLTPLRTARVHLLAVTLDPWALSEARALASIDVAIAAVGSRRRPSTPQRTP
jgi:hypothetical protein